MLYAIATSTWYKLILMIFNKVSQHQAYQLGVQVGIPGTFLLTAVISSLVASLITYLCLTRRGSHKSTPPVQEEPVYDRVSHVEMKSNKSYDHVITIEEYDEVVNIAL